MQCYAIGGRINFNYDTVSFCHGMDIGDKIIWEYSSGEIFNVDYYLKKVKEFNEKNNSLCKECEGCSNLVSGEAGYVSIDIVTINPNWFCQNRCVYCGNFQGERKELYNPLHIIKEFIERGLISKKCLFDWGGGEPTVSDCFEEIYLYLLENNYMQRINTNAIKICNVIINNWDSELVTLRFSLDAGNREAFLHTKGRDLFEQVITNICEYRKITSNIVVKYVVTCTNSDDTSIIDFVELMKKLNVETICVDTEMMSFGSVNYNGLLRFTEKELHAAKRLVDLCVANGLKTQIGYVWTAQNNNVPSRDFNQLSSIHELNQTNIKYQIPDGLYKSHIEHNEMFHQGIEPFVVSSWECFMHEIKGKRLFVYGAGKNGKQLIKALEVEGYFEYLVVDKQKVGEIIHNREIISPQNMIEILDDTCRIIVTPGCANEIIREFNDLEYSLMVGKVMVMDSYRYTDVAIRALEKNREMGM